jgi:uncharacterized membrane protein YecN with MAPEG domain
MIHVTLVLAAVAAIVNIWLGLRCGQVRTKEKISHGDGGSVLLARRMRAQLNFAENAPIVLILTLACELSGVPGLWLAICAVLFIVARIAHAIGMDADVGGMPRMVGVLFTMLITLALAIMALCAHFGVIGGDATIAPTYVQASR